MNAFLNQGRLQQLRSFLLGPPIPAQETLRYQSLAMERCFLTVRLFYAICLFELVNDLGGLGKWSKAKGMDPLWLVSWVPEVGAGIAAPVLFLGATLAAVSLLLVPQVKALRIAFFVLVTLVGGFLNSFGKINHDWHAAILISFFLVFLPAGTPKELRRSFSATRAYVLVTALAIASFMFCYSVSGFWKVAVGFYQVAIGEVHAFHPHALAYHVTRRLAQVSASPSPIAAFLIENPWVGWAPYLLTLYGEFFALLAGFRIHAHRVFGLILLGFHMGSELTLGIGFRQHQLLLLGLLVVSPLSPPSPSLAQVWESLPLFGDVTRWLRRRRG